MLPRTSRSRGLFVSLSIPMALYSGLSIPSVKSEPPNGLSICPATQPRELFPEQTCGILLGGCGFLCRTSALPRNQIQQLFPYFTSFPGSYPWFVGPIHVCSNFVTGIDAGAAFDISIRKSSANFDSKIYVLQWRQIFVVNSRWYTTALWCLEGVFL